MKSENLELVKINERRWRLRFLILGTVVTILSLKIYFLLFLVDVFVGIYSVITSFVLLSFLMSSYLKFKDPYSKINPKKIPNYSCPLISIIIPVKNEEKNIENCVNSSLNSTYSNKEIIIVNDGSTDKTGKILDKMKTDSRIQVLHLPKNLGKKKAIEKASSLAKGEFFIFMDSDCTMSSFSPENAVKIFQSDEKIAAVTAHGRVRNAKNRSSIFKLQDVWYDGQYRIIKGTEGSFSSVTCCSGAFTAFRRKAIQPFIHAWANDQFLGTEFRFATDRLLTAFILGVKNSKQEKNSTSYDSSPSTNHIGLEKNLTKKLLLHSKFDSSESSNSSFQWKVEYSPSVRVSIGPPETFLQLIKQQIRWRKSFIRSLFATGLVYWRRPFFAALLYYLQIGLKIIRPFIVLHSLVLLPLLGDFVTAIFYIFAVSFTGMIYAVDFRLRNPGDSSWIYRPLMTLISTFFLSWLLVYAAVTIRNMSWR